MNENIVRRAIAFQKYDCIASNVAEEYVCRKCDGNYKKGMVGVLATVT